MQTFAQVRFYLEDDSYIEPAEPWRMDVLVEDDQPEESSELQTRDTRRRWQSLLP
jgi:hypothetical protein